jgi:hypothetical protein
MWTFAGMHRYDITVCLLFADCVQITRNNWCHYGRHLLEIMEGTCYISISVLVLQVSFNKRAERTRSKETFLNLCLYFISFETRPKLKPLTKARPPPPTPISLWYQCHIETFARSIMSTGTEGFNHKRVFYPVGSKLMKKEVLHVRSESPVSGLVFTLR